MHGDITQSTYTAASLIELLHTATLIHDDVVDESYQRRGFFSINALWKSKISVLVGDYLLAKGLLHSIENKDYDLLEIVSGAVKDMSEGELLQIQKARNLNFDEDIYYEIIRKKTASLFTACAACGARSVTTNTDVIAHMKQFGEFTGIAFQIKDDLFDYQLNNKSGKPSGNDIKEKKMTLPLIYSLNNCTNSSKKQIVKLINNSNNQSNGVMQIIDFVTQFGGLDYATSKMEEYKNKALQILDSYPANEASDSLRELLEYTTKRNN
jgi:octaprenyl-diphosphate synthase